MTDFRYIPLIMRIAFVLGTRPEIIKTAPLIFAAQDSGDAFDLIHTGQHFDWGMDGRFFAELDLPKPDLILAAGGKPYAEQVAYLIRELAKAFEERRPDVVVLQGDTVTVMAGALAAQRIGIPVAHHEAGLRSRDQHMSEEYHRIITDHLSELLCAPTESAMKNLMSEGVPESRCRMTGNTIVDAVRRFAAKAHVSSDIHRQLNIGPAGYFLLTFHRGENVDVKERFASGLQALSDLRIAHPDRPIVFPVHPRVERRRAEFGFSWPEGVIALPPLGYLDMLKLLAEADVVMTDSGGLQEEASILGTPCVTLRDSTERPETVDAGVNILAGVDAKAIVEAVTQMRGKRFAAGTHYGDGRAAERILASIRDVVLSREPASA